MRRKWLAFQMTSYSGIFIPFCHRTLTQLSCQIWIFIKVIELLELLCVYSFIILCIFLKYMEMKINYNLSSVLNIANIYKDKRNYKETIFYQINFVYINLYQSKKLSRNCMTQANKKYFTILTSVLKIISREFST